MKKIILLSTVLIFVLIKKKLKIQKLRFMTNQSNQS